MTTSLLEIVNKALATLGTQPLVNIESSNTSPTAIIVKNTFEITKRALLMETDWNCARKTRKLAKLATQNKYGWENAFALPTEEECLKIVQISIDNGETFIDLNDYYNNNAGPKESLYDLDGNILLSNADSVWIKYIADIDPSYFDPLLADALAAKLAAEICYAITASTTNADYLAKVAQLKLKKAKSRNALNRNIPRLEGDTITVRGYMGTTVSIDREDEEL